MTLSAIMFGCGYDDYVNTVVHILVIPRVVMSPALLSIFLLNLSKILIEVK